MDKRECYFNPSPGANQYLLSNLKKKTLATNFWLCGHFWLLASLFCPEIQTKTNLYPPYCSESSAGLAPPTITSTVFSVRNDNDCVRSPNPSTDKTSTVSSLAAAFVLFTCMPSINIARIASRSSADSLGVTGLGTTMILGLLSGVGGRTGMFWDRLFWGEMFWERLFWEGLFWRRLFWEGLFWQRLFWEEKLWEKMF